MAERTVLADGGRCTATLLMVSYDAERLDAWLARASEYPAGTTFNMLAVHRLKEPPSHNGVSFPPGCVAFRRFHAPDGQKTSERTLCSGGFREAWTYITEHRSFELCDSVVFLSDESVPVGEGWLERMVERKGLTTYGDKLHPVALSAAMGDWVKVAAVAGDALPVPVNWGGGGAAEGERGAFAELRRRFHRAALPVEHVDAAEIESNGCYAQMRDGLLYEAVER